MADKILKSILTNLLFFMCVVIAATFLRVSVSNLSGIVHFLVSLWSVVTLMSIPVFFVLIVWSV